MPDFPAIGRSIARVAPPPAGQPEAVAGGCIHRCFRWGEYFLKVNTPDHAAHFAAEAVGLGTLGASGATRTPQVVLHDRTGDTAFLVLEHLDLRPAGDEALLGQQLARLHTVTADRFGFPQDNFIGSTPQPNGWHDHWPDFFRDRRIDPLLRRLADRGIRFPQADRFLARLPGLLPPDPPRSLLHGDLWGGNKAFLADGTPVLFDPACFHGDAECDLAMTRLFGGFHPVFYDSYRSQHPAPDDESTLHEIYNLYHVINHALLFGGGYLAQARDIIRRFA